MDILLFANSFNEKHTLLLLLSEEEEEKDKGEEIGSEEFKKKIAVVYEN